MPTFELNNPTQQLIIYSETSFQTKEYVQDQYLSFSWYLTHLLQHVAIFKSFNFSIFIKYIEQLR